MDHKHFQSAKRLFSVIFNSKPTNQMIRYKHEGQVSAKIKLEQKADFLKFDSKLVNTRSRTTIQKCQWINRLNALVNWKISLSFVRKHLYSIKDIIPVRGAGRSIIGGGGNVHIFVLCTINFFWNRNLDFKFNCFYSLWTRIYECCPPPPPIYRSSGTIKQTKYVV